MAITSVEELQKAISQAGHSWRVRELTPGEPPHALGWQPSGAQKIQRAMVVGDAVARSRFPNLKSAPGAVPAPAPSDGGPSGGPAGGPGQPSSFDWRTKGVIGPVRDQKQCGSCVSFATTGLVGAMAGIELGAVDLELSEADQHFDSSHGPTCSGWNNDDALDQIKSRGVSTEGTFPYMMAFDNPPVADLSTPDHEWIAHNRAEPNRAFRTYSITDYSGWTGDLRKFYLALVGPLVCGFAVYEDFDHYAGGVYRHEMGNFRGGHAVLVVGFSDIEQAWICRNSWGAGFGGPANADGTGAGFFKIGYGECNIDNEPFYGCHGVISPATLPMVTGASRSAGKLDVLAAGTDDGTYSAAWQPGDTAWRGWWRLQGGVAAPGTFVHVVSRSADHLDAFCVGTDHHVYTAAWQTGDNTWRGWWRVGDLTVAPNSSVTAVSRSANKLDIFAVGADMGVYTAAWQPGDTAWRGWWQIQGGVAAPNTSVFGVSRSADKLDIFSVGTDHGTYTAAWQAGDTSWRGWWRIQGGTVAPNTSVTAVSRGADKLDVFCVGTNHGAYTAAWQTGDSSWRGWWRIQDGVVAPDTSVFGVSRSADKLDIFSVGTDHGIYTAAWQPGFPAWHGWWRLAGGVAAPGTSVYAVSRSADRLDVFSIGTDHSICTSAWQPGFANWQDWSKMAGGVAEGG